MNIQSSFRCASTGEQPDSLLGPDPSLGGVAASRVTRSACCVPLEGSQPRPCGRKRRRLSRAFSGRAGSAIFVPTACRSVAGGSACPRSGLSRQRTDLEIVIIPAADQHYLSANVVPRGRPTCHHHVRPGQTLCRAAPECVMTAPTRVIDAPNRRMTAPQCVMTGLGPTRFTQVWNV